jgi:ribonuclease HII
VAVSLDFEKAAGDPAIGVDEAGRGPLAGAVYAAAVSVPLELAEKLLDGEWSAVNDSKKLTHARREALAEKIREKYPECDVEVQYGGQPIYFYLISLE